MRPGFGAGYPRNLTLEEAVGRSRLRLGRRETDSLRSFLMRTPKPETLSLTAPEGGLN